MANSRLETYLQDFLDGMDPDEAMELLRACDMTVGILPRTSGLYGMNDGTVVSIDVIYGPSTEDQDRPGLYVAKQIVDGKAVLVRQLGDDDR